MMTPDPIRAAYAELQANSLAFANARLVNGQIAVTPEMADKIRQLAAFALVQSQPPPSYSCLSVVQIELGTTRDLGDGWMVTNHVGVLSVARMARCSWGDDCDD